VPLVIGIIAVLAVAGGIAAFALKGGGDDSAADASTTTTPVTEQPTSTTEAARTCEAPSGRCVFLEPIEVEGDHFLLSYFTDGFTPDIDGDETSHHIHFFFDNIPPEQAGAPGAGPWVLWDFDENGDTVFRGYKTADVPAGATSICALVADHHHALDTGTIPDCQPLPS
jgi:hypothetical protein